MAAKKRKMHVIGKPLSRKEFVFRGVRFFTKNLGAHDDFANQFVWFAPGCWTHDSADGVFSCVVGAVADRFNMDSLGLWAAEKFRTEKQISEVRELEKEIVLAMNNFGLSKSDFQPQRGEK